MQNTQTYSNLESSKQLQKVGFKCTPHFYWIIGNDSQKLVYYKEIYLFSEDQCLFEGQIQECIPAFSIDQILKHLPEGVRLEKRFTPDSMEVYYICGFVGEQEGHISLWKECFCSQLPIEACINLYLFFKNTV